MRILLVIACLLLPTSLATAKPADYGMPCERFTVQGRPAFVLTPPEKKSSNTPWVLYAPTLPHYPDKHERKMHERFLQAGVAVAGVDVGECYGSPKSHEVFDKFYAEMTQKRGFARKPCLLARSRGGLWHVSWAANRTDRVAALAGIYPCFDLQTYPGLNRAAKAYGLTAGELKQQLGKLNPIQSVHKLAKARVPALLIHGDLDKVVPLKENSARFAQIYRDAGDGELATLRILKGQGHNFWPGFFIDKELIDFAIKHARLGAANQKVKQ